MELSSIALGSYLILLNRQGPKLVLPRNGDAIRILMQDLLCSDLPFANKPAFPELDPLVHMHFGQRLSAVVWSPDLTPDYQRDASSDIRN